MRDRFILLIPQFPQVPLYGWWQTTSTHQPKYRTEIENGVPEAQPGLDRAHLSANWNLSNTVTFARHLEKGTAHEWINLLGRVGGRYPRDSIVFWSAVMASVVAEGTATGVVRRQFPYVQWGPIVAGAFAAAALALVLDAFAAAVGLGVSSTAPTWRDSSVGLWFLTGVYLIVVALAAYGLGGYIAGRMRDRLAEGVDADREARDGIHGLLVWALATLLTAGMIGIVVPATSRLAAPSSGPSGPSTSVAGENLIAFDLDRLFRGARLQAAADMEYPRAEAARILLTSTGHQGVSSDDHAYLIRRVSEVTGLSAADAQKRVDATIESARQNIQRARHAAVVLAFCAGAAALIGAVVAWFTADLGGKHRDTGGLPMWGVTR